MPFLQRFEEQLADQQPPQRQHLVHLVIGQQGSPAQKDVGRSRDVGDAALDALLQAAVAYHMSSG